jgi:glycosyltransferase involved in cell wall biosynthesis
MLTHASNVAASTAALAGLGESGARVVIAGSWDVALGAGASLLAPRTPLVFLYHSEFYSEWVQALGGGVRAKLKRAVGSYMRWAERRVLGLATRIVAVSQFSAEQIRERAPWAADKIVVIPTGVDTAFFTPVEDRAAARSALGYGEEPVLLGVGRLAGVKQFDRLIAAVGLLRDRGVRVRLALAGDGPLRADLEAQVRSLGLQDQVEFRGFCDADQLRAVMQAADIQVCSSAFENFSLAILEGLACGTPVLGTPGGGTPELVGGLDQRLVLPGDSAEAMADGVERLLADPAELARLRTAARAYVAERYDWGRVVDRLETLIAEVAP